jgi:hypothetical protein
MRTCNDPVLARVSLELLQLLDNVFLLPPIPVEPFRKSLFITVSALAWSLLRCWWLSIYRLLVVDEISWLFWCLNVIVLLVRKLRVPVLILLLRVIKVAEIRILVQVSVDIVIRENRGLDRRRKHLLLIRVTGSVKPLTIIRSFRTTLHRRFEFPSLRRDGIIVKLLGVLSQPLEKIVVLPFFWPISSRRRRFLFLYVLHVCVISGVLQRKKR